MAYARSLRERRANGTTTTNATGHRSESGKGMESVIADTPREQNIIGLDRRGERAGKRALSEICRGANEKKRGI